MCSRNLFPFVRSFFTNPSKIGCILFAGVLMILVSGGLGITMASVEKGLEKGAYQSMMQKTLKLQLPFVENNGQIKDKDVLFYAQTFGGSVNLRRTGEIVYAFPNTNSTKTDIDRRPLILREKLVNSAQPSLKGAERSPTTVNYILGNDKNKWKTGISTYNAVGYGDVYEGITLSVRAYGKTVEKIFTVHPGADVAAIRMSVENAGVLSINGKGELEVATSQGTIKYSRPVAFQEGKEARQEVTVGYYVSGNTYGFKVGAYNRSEPLIIDPVIEYAVFLGGAEEDSANAIAVDADGNAYVTGSTVSPFSTEPNNLIDKGGVNLDVFVAEISSDNELTALVYLGGRGDDIGHGIAVDDFYIYITGQTSSKKFPTAKAFDNKIGGNTDAFIAKLNKLLPPENTLIYSTYLGGGGPDIGYAIAVWENDEGENEVCVVGESLSSNFPTTPQAAFADSQGGVDAFVTKLTPEGQLDVGGGAFSTYIAGNGDDTAYGVAFDEDGNVYVTGQTDSSNFPVRVEGGGTPFQELLSGLADAFVSVFNNSGSAVLYSTFLGGSNNDSGRDIAVTGSLADGPDIYVVGSTESNPFPGIPGIQDGTAGGSDAFVTILYPDGIGPGDLGFSSVFGSAQDGETANSVDVDDIAGRVCITGNIGGGYLPEASGEPTDGAFVLLLNVDNPNDVIYSSYLGEGHEDAGYGVALDEQHIYVAGQTYWETFPQGKDTVVGFGGMSDGFAVKIALNIAPVAVDDSYSTNEDSQLNVPAQGVLANDTDDDGDSLKVDLSVSPSDGPSSGSLTLDEDGSFTYTPDPNYNGSDSFTYTVSDGKGGEDTATVTITVTSVNDAPVANAQAVNTAEDISFGITLTGSDVDGNPLTFSVTSGPSFGTLSGTEPSLTYTPNGNFNGSDSFTYTVSDGKGGEDTATVTITVTSVNDAPVANAQAVNTAEDISFGITLTGSDVDGNPLTFSVTSGPSFGTLSGTEPSLTYTPNGNFNGSDSFTYTVSDGKGGEDTATVTITVNPIPDEPIAVDDSYSTDEDTVLTIPAPGVLDNDTDDDGDWLKVDLNVSPSGGPSSGSLTLDEDGSFTYTPNSDYHGPDSFTYTAFDGTYNSIAAATVSITVNSVNDAPYPDPNVPIGLVNLEMRKLGEDGSTPIDLTPHFIDIESDALSINSVTINGCSDLSYSTSGMMLALTHSTDLSCLQGSVAVDVKDSHNAVSAVGTFDICLDDIASTLDSDGDFIGNECDADDDNDGVLDGDDNCPVTYNNGQEDWDDDGLGNVCDPDADDDGCVSFIYYDSAIHSCWDCDDLDDAITGGDCLLGATEKPVKTNTTSDSDNDGVDDPVDNCPNVANSNQIDSDGDGQGDACDDCPNANDGNDVDGDGVCGLYDNCPDDPNADQSDVDGDQAGDTCDTDADGDTYAFPADCNDLDAGIKPGADEILDGIDNDCDGLIDNITIDGFRIEFEMLQDYDAWLPSDGNIANVTAMVMDDNTDVSDDYIITITADNISNYPGKYTNDPDVGDVGLDFSFTVNPSINRIDLTSHDYGGTVTVHVEATPVSLGDTLVADFKLPKDIDNDNLPDAWETYYGNLGTANSFQGDLDGDGLTNAEEARGFIWGPFLVFHAYNVMDTEYQTDAYIPEGAVEWFSTDPARQDLFIKVEGYDFPGPYTPDMNSPFALGAAFHNAGVDVHVASIDMNSNIADWELNIDAAKITNNLGGTYASTDGHINKRGIRDWSWDVKGFSGIGNATTYGVGTTTYQKPLDLYFSDRPYIDVLTIGTLEYIDDEYLEDVNDNGILDKKEDKDGDKEIDGDLLAIPISYNGGLSAFDIDGDGYVELPLMTNPAAAVPDHLVEGEYSKAQVLKHTITHELGHAVGMSHTPVNTCVMYEYSIDWKRDGMFSYEALNQMSIHSN